MLYFYCAMMAAALTGFGTVWNGLTGHPLDAAILAGCTIVNLGGMGIGLVMMLGSKVAAMQKIRDATDNSGGATFPQCN
jgi:hypothetical protein